MLFHLRACSPLCPYTAEDNVHHSEKQRKETAEINASLYALKVCVGRVGGRLDRKRLHLGPGGFYTIHVV